MMVMAKILMSIVDGLLLVAVKNEFAERFVSVVVVKNYPTPVYRVQAAGNLERQRHQEQNL